MNKPKQISLNDIYAGCLESFDNDKPKFLSALEEHFDIDALIPLSFKMHFSNVPYSSKFTRFKQVFKDDLKTISHRS